MTRYRIFSPSMHAYIYNLPIWGFLQPCLGRPGYLARAGLIASEVGRFLWMLAHSWNWDWDFLVRCYHGNNDDDDDDDGGGNNNNT